MTNPTPPPELNPQPSLSARFLHVARIWEIVDLLRGEPGCPWDRKQTPESVQTYLVEEAHEAAAAILSAQPAEAMDELGDLLFMVLFVVHLYEEAGSFRLEDVCARITEKMIRRHPHVFGNTVVESTQDVRDNWEKIKAAESNASGKENDLTSIPATLPALMRAYRVLSRLTRQDPAWEDAAAQCRRASAQLQALEENLPAKTGIASGVFGELLLSLVNLARIAGYRAEDCLQQTMNDLLAPARTE
jgi:MazG family protein